MAPVPGLCALPAQLSDAVRAVGSPRGHGRGCAMGLVEREPPWAATGVRWLESSVLRSGPGSGMRSLRLGRLGGCLSLAGIMSSECNASAYE